MKLEITMTYIVDCPDENMHRADALDYAEGIVNWVSARAGLELSMRDVDMVEE